MTKIKLLPLLISVLVFLFSAAGAYAINLEGEWLVGKLRLKAEQSGDTFSLLVINPDAPAKFRGIAELKGTIDGNTFTGQKLTYHKECPNLDDYRPARGTISNRKIVAVAIFFRYDPEACTLDPGTETEVTDTYTKILTQQEQALQDYQDELARLGEDLANRPGPVVDTSNATVVSTSPVAKSERYPVNVGADTRPDLSTYVDYLGQTPNVSVPVWGKEIGRISDFAGNLILHKTYKGEATDRETYRAGTSIHYNILHEGDTFSFKGDGFVQYHGVDGSIKQFMTAGYAKEHGYGDQIQPGQAGLEIILKPAEPIPVPPAPPGPIQRFFNWLGELLTPEPQPTPYGIVGVKG